MTRFILALVLIWIIASASSDAQLIPRVDASEARRLANTYRLCVLGVGCGGVGPAVLTVCLGRWTSRSGAQGHTKGSFAWMPQAA